MSQSEVPSPVNFHLMQDALDWESTAMERPFRLDMFGMIAECIESRGIGNALELGSGPGFLARYLCDRVADISLTLLDFSEPMQILARTRLKDCVQNIRFVRRDFKSPEWTQDLGTFDCVVTTQAVHELRHKSRAKALHRRVKGDLDPGGVYLVCDHFYGPDAMSDGNLYMTPDEQVSCLSEAGFRAEVLLRKGSLQLVFAS